MNCFIERMNDDVKYSERSGKFYSTTKVKALESTLKQSLTNFEELIVELEKVYIESECYRNQVLEQKEKCENKSCASSEALKHAITLKDNIIQSVAAILIELNETKNFEIISDALRIISGEKLPLTPPTSGDDTKEPLEDKIDQNSKTFTPLSESSYKDSSVSEIEDTPLGRKSPIIQSKKFKNPSTSVNNVKGQEKKKCSETWSTPEKKTIKLTFPTPTRGKTNGKLRQARLNLVRVKSSTVVDLTSSPKPREGIGVTKVMVACRLEFFVSEHKKEVIENDDTILPSPTSGPIDFQTVFRTIAKNSPSKSIKNSSLLRLKCKDENDVCNTKGNNIQINEDADITEMEESISNLKQRCKNSPSKFRKLSVSKLKMECTTFVDSNDENAPAKEINESVDILRHFPNRFPYSPTKQQPTTPVKSKEPNSEDVNESMSLLQRMNQFVDRGRETGINLNSPDKRPLSENNNIGNIPSACDGEASAAVLPADFKGSNTNETGKRTKADLIEPIFKEPTVRKKAEKRALPGWSCDECKEFYAELYKHDPERLRRKMDECSRHRGRREPARARTPPGFWQPRWHVPRDTDDFNRLNGAL